MSIHFNGLGEIAVSPFNFKVISIFTRFCEDQSNLQVKYSLSTETMINVWMRKCHLVDVVHEVVSPKKLMRLPTSIHGMKLKLENPGSRD